jgi:hypothetical protein
MNKSKLSALLGCTSLLFGLQASAAMYDLSSGGSDSVSVTGGTGGTAVFNTIFDQPAGTGYIEPFLRTQLLGQPGSYCDGNNCEQAYNTDGAKQYDTKDDNQWNHALLLSDIPIVTINGVQYREFLLDINQNQGNPDQEMLSLDELQFFITTDQYLTGYNDDKNLFNGGTSLVWELDAYNNPRNALTTDNWLLLENCKDPGTCGSGDYDMQALIPSEVFGMDDSVYVTLFNRFGDNAGSTGANDGFEEWAVRQATNGGGGGGGDPIPEPGILSLALIGLIGMISTRRRRLPG